LLVACLAIVCLAGCAASGISGTVVDATTRLPLEGVEVRAGDLTALSDRNGHYQLKLEEGNYQVVISKEGYVSYQTDLTLESKANRIQLDLPLEQRQLSGVILDQETNAPLEGVKVRIGEAEASSDAQGAFCVSALPGNTLSISKSGYIGYELDAAGLNALFDQTGKLSAAFGQSLAPRVVNGLLLDESDNRPISETAVLIGEQQTTTDANGAFQLRMVDPGQPIKVDNPGYRVPEGLVYNGEADLRLVLKPYQVTVQVSDAESGEALPEALVAVPKGDVKSQGDGSFIVRASLGATISASLLGYKNGSVTYNGEETLALQLGPAQVVGQLTSAETGEPITIATVLAYTSLPKPAVLNVDEQGRFFYPGNDTVKEILVKAPGYERITVPITRTGMLRLSLETFEARALYIPYGLLYAPAVYQEILDMAAGTDMNAVVVDLKDDLATLAWDSQVPMAKEIGAHNPDILDVRDIIAMAHERNIYVIGRLVVFKDVLLAKAHPEWVVQRSGGGPYYDLEGLMWVDPFVNEVQQYNIDLAIELAEMGIDEVQYDYVRFPSDGSVSGLVYSKQADYKGRTDAVAAFIAKSHAALATTPAFFSVDVFGLVPWMEPGNDMGIGQTMEAIAPNVDYICPMLYPTTFGPGELGYNNPGYYPYEIVYRSVMVSHERSTTKVRPWLQHYSIFGIQYGPVEILLQRKAADDANSCGWTYWNAAGWYDHTSIASGIYSQYPQVAGANPGNMQ